MKKLYYSIIFLILTSLIYCDEGAGPSLASTEGLVNSMVEGCVSAVTGDFVHQEVDLVIPGPYPLALKRTYSGCNSFHGQIYCGWQLSDPSRMTVQQQVRSHQTNLMASLTTAHGAQAKYYQSVKREKETELVLKNARGYTNCGAGMLSGRNNLKNNRLFIKKSDKGTSATSKAGDGSKRDYIFHYEDGSGYHFDLWKDEKRNNTQKTYKYNEGGFVREVQCTDWLGVNNYGALFFDRGHKDQVRVSSNTHKQVIYHFCDYQFKVKTNGQKGTYSRQYLTKVERPDRPQESYKYVEAEAHPNTLMLYQVEQYGKILKAVDYYGKEDKVDPRIIDRVKTLKKPVGVNGTLLPTHHFHYHLQKEGEVAEVTDIHGHKTFYYQDKDQRLHTIQKPDGTQEVFYWGAKDTPQEGNLIGTYILGANRQILTGKAFWYDAHGNVIHLREYGHLTGHNPTPIILGVNHYPIENGAEYYPHTYTYGSYNRLIREEEGNGKITEYAYLGDSQLPLKKIIRDSQQVWLVENYTYDSQFFLIAKEVQDGANTYKRITRYVPRQSIPFGLPAQVSEHYEDENGQEHLLSRIVNYHTIEGHLIAQDHFDSQDVLRYSLTWAYDAHGNVIHEQDALGQVIQREYDCYDRLIKEKGPCPHYYTTFTYDPADRLIDRTEFHDDGTQLKTTYVYDCLGRCTHMTNPQGHTTVYTYDGMGRLIATQYPSVINGQNQIVQPVEHISYNPLGQKAALIDKNGHRTAFHYNVKGQPLHKEYPDGTSEHYTYHLDGTLEKALHRDKTYTIYQYDCLGHLLGSAKHSTTGECLIGHAYTYNYFNLLSEIDELGCQTTYQYDRAGRLVAKVTLDQKTTYTYDSLGRVHQEIAWLFDKALVKTYQYDLLNRIIEEKVEDLTGEILTLNRYTYNTFGQKTHIQAGLSSETTLYNSRQEPIKKIDAEGHETHISYAYGQINHIGQRVTVIDIKDPLGQWTLQELDVFGRVFKEECYGEGKLLSRKFNFYNPEGDLEMVRLDRIVEGVMQESLHHQWIYNPVHELIHLTEALGSPQERHTHTLYNELGQKVALIKPDGIQLHYTYDTLGRLHTLTSSDQTIAYRYAYNNKDQVTQCEDLIHQQTTQRTYDALGRLIQETLGHGHTLQYTYDSFNRKTQVLLPDNTPITYTYDTLRLRQITRKGYTHTYDTFDLSGNLLKSTLPLKAGEIHYTYDSLNRIREISHPKYTQKLRQFDAVGNLLHIQSQDTDQHFTYDPLYQLKEEQGFEEHRYHCDSLYNRQVKDEKPCQHSLHHELLFQDGITYTYDLNGNLIEKMDQDRKSTFTYDALNRMIASDVGDVHTTYTYDAFHRRLSKNQEQYLYENQDEIGVIKSGKLHALRILGLSKEAEIGGAVALEIDNQIYIPLHDHNGNVVALLDKNGQPLQEYQYTAFGIAQNPPDFNPWRFASKHYDSETQLVYFGRRYYDPVMGRWTTPDPADYSDGPNLYTYLQNNPLIYIDGYGLLSLPSWQDAKDVGHGLRQGAELLGQGIGHSITSSGEWLNADFEYEYGGDASSFRAKSQQSAEEWSALGQAFRSNPMQTAGSMLIPGIMDIINLPANATRSETLQAYGRGAFDVLTFFAGSKVGSVNKTGIVARETLGIEGSICQKLLKNSKPQISNVDLVINETLQGRGVITSMYKLSATEALEVGEKFLGKQYRELGELGSGVFRSNDNFRQFRIDKNSLLGKHNPHLRHVHLERLDPVTKTVLINNHVLIGE